MNYLAHGISCNHQAEVLLGCILPDLVRKLPNNSKPNAKFWTSDFFSNDIKKGIQLHFEQDRIFHNSDFFKTYTASHPDWVSTGPLAKYGFFFRHIWLEFSLDRWLVQQEFCSPNEFYSELYAALQSKHFLLLPQWMQEKINRFHLHQYLRQFEEDSAVSIAVQKTAQLIGLTIPDSEIKQLPHIFELYHNLWDSTEFSSLCSALNWDLQ